LFLPTFRYAREDTLLGMLPENRLPCSCAVDSDANESRNGSGPLKELYGRLSDWRDVGSGGTVPVILRWLKIVRLVRDDSCEMDGGRVPTSEAW